MQDILSVAVEGRRVDGLLGGAEGHADVLGMFECVGFLLELVLLVFEELCVVELLVLESQVVFVVAAALLCVDGFGQEPTCVAECVVELAEGSESFGILAQYVEDAELEVLASEQQVLVLGVDVDEAVGKLSEQVELDRCVVDEGTALAGGGEFAADDAVVSVEVEVVLLEKVLECVVVYVELGFDDAACGPSLDGSGVGPLSAQQSQCAEDNGFSCTRLAGDDGEAVGELDVQAVDECVVFNV